MSKHTPGPWRIRSVQDYNAKDDASPNADARNSHWCEIEGNPGLHSKTVCGFFDEPGIANAHLIAAAPGMLHNLREARQALNVVRDHFEATGRADLVEDMDTEILALKLIIDKAEGKS